LLDPILARLYEFLWRFSLYGRARLQPCRNRCHTNTALAAEGRFSVVLAQTLHPPPQLIVKLIVGLAFDDPGVAEIGSVVGPVTVTFNVPDDDARVVASPR